VQEARQREVQEGRELLQAGAEASISQVLQLAQELKASLLMEQDLSAREARMAWRLKRWQLHEKRCSYLKVRFVPDVIHA
jgi:hypothetical protein